MSQDSTTPLSTQFRNLPLRQARKEARERFLAGRKAESFYARHLKQVARHVGNIVNGMAPEGVVTDLAKLTQTLHRYADILEPWAASVARRMMEDVSRRDAAAWEKHAKAIGTSLKKEIETAPTGAAMRAMLADRVNDITSLPREAAQRLFKLTTEGIVSGTRAREIQGEILATSDVTIGRAKMLARTGVSTTAEALTEARARHIGSEGYFWRTTKDRAVRPSHRAMEGKFVRWDDPPTLDGYTAHAGCFANCRCFQEPVIPERYGVR